jgi:signal transduction histidine kinase
MAREIGMRAEIARAERIRQRTVRQLFSAQAGRDGVAIVFDALRDLFGEHDVVLYMLLDTGVLHRLRARGRHQAYLHPQIPAMKGHAGWVAQHRESYYEPDVTAPRAGAPCFLQPVPEAPYLSAVSFPVLIPNPKTLGEAVGVLQICAFQKNAFPLHLHPFAQAIIDSASLHEYHAHRVFEARHPRPVSRSLNNWHEDLIQILQDALRNRSKALECRRSLCQAAATHFWKICGSWNASLRWVDADGGLRFIACAGEGWTEALKKQYYRNDEGSTGAFAARTGSIAFVEDTRAPTLPYREIFPETRSVIAFPIKERDKVVAVLSADAREPRAFSPLVKRDAAFMCAEFEATLDALLVIEHGLIRSLEETLILSGGMERFASQASMLLGTLFGADACSIFTRQDGAMAQQGALSEIRGHGKVESVDAIGMELARDVAESGALFRGRMQGHPCLAVPIKTQGIIRAVVCLIGRALERQGKANSGEFSAEDETFLEQVSEWLQEMLAGFFAMQEAGHLNRAAREKAESAQRLLTAEGIDSLGQALAELVLLETGAVGVHFRIPSREGGLRLCGSAGLYQQVLVEDRKVGTGVSSAVMEAGEALWADHAEGHSAWAGALMELRQRLRVDQLWIRSSCGLPLKADDDTVIGTLVVDWREPQTFEVEQHQQLMELARRSARLFQRILREHETTTRLARQVNMAAEVREIAAEYARTQNLDDLLEGIRRMAIDQTGMEWGAIRLKNPESGKLVLHAPPAPRKGQLDAIDESEITRLGMDSDQPVLLSNLQQDQRWRRYIDGCKDADQRQFFQALGSLVMVPIRADGPVGLLALYGRPGQAVDEDTLALLTILASYAAVAIEFDRVRRQLDQVIPLAALTEVVADFLHVFTNHVNAVQALADTIQATDLTTEQAAARMGRLRHRIDGLLKACQSIRNASNQPARSRVVVNDLVSTVLKDFEDTFAESVERRTQLEPDLAVWGSSAQIESVIRHVLRNAFEAQPGGGLVMVWTRTDAKSGEAIIEIEDNGPGMSAETLEKCGRPFYTTKQGRGGSGLGLWISTQILRRIGGKLEIQSEEGKGSTVRIVLPRGE